MEERHIRTSAKALVIRNGRMLAVKVRDEFGAFYILPGGGQMPGETLPAAVEREVAEETGLRVRAEKLVFAVEGAEGEPDHRIDLVFLCRLFPEKANEHRVNDRNQIGIEWLPLETLNREPLYPSRLRRAVMNLWQGIETPVYLGNENMGDPEITE